ncbi:condensation domain-containing protein, partial [Nonomuraea sp. ZG12]|uniref:condensation domain-containing protein n=1 Tax=Nonomuraea sp. ZG12 TaxID=3452207 RepID=UPI003F8B7DC3
FRIELGEIEAALDQLPGIAQSTVIVRDDTRGKQLVGYVVPTLGHQPTSAQVRADLGVHLPAFMVPAAIVVLEAFPLTPNGKIDRAALPAPVYATAGHSAARTPAEEILAGLFAEVLHLPAVDIHDNFFDLGGHSLLATRLISRVRRTLDRELTVRDLFEAPTVAALATRLDGNTAVRPSVRRRSRDTDVLPLSFAQQRLWFIDQIQGPSAAYNIPLALEITGSVDVQALERALGDVVGRHEPLRTIYPVREGQPYQQVLPAHIRLIRDEGGLAEAVSGAFALEREVPIRAHLFTHAPDHHTLLLVIHHIAADGWSLEPLARDLATAYAARSAGRTPQWEPLPVNYADYVDWQRDLLDSDLLHDQLAFWTQALHGAPEQLALPYDHPRPTRPTGRGEVIEFHVDAQTHLRVQELARAHGVSVFM